MLQRLGIRGKILAVVAVPILVLMLAAGFITYGATQDLSAAQNSEQLVETLDTARDLEAALQDERYAGVNFVHVIQDTRAKLTVGKNDTDDALEATVARVYEVGGDDAQALVDSLYTALDITSAEDEILVDERSLDIERPSEEGGWVTFPSADEVAAMQEGYASAQVAVDEVAATASEDADGTFQTLSFRIGFESQMATQLFTEPLAYQEQFEAVTADVDAGIAAMLGSTEQLDDNEANAAAVGALAAGEAAVANLDSVRAGIASSTGNVLTYLGFYRGLLTTIVNAADDVAVAMTDREVVAAMQAYGDLDALVENMEYEKVQFQRLIRTGAYEVGESTQARTLIVTTDISRDESETSSASIPGAETVPAYGASLSFGSALDQQSFESVRAAVVRGIDSDLVAQRDADWTTQVDEELTAYEPLREDLWNSVEDMVAEDSQAALLQAVLTGLIAILVIVASVVVALLISRRIVNPLRRLTTTATAVRQELPRLVERVAMPGETVDVSEVQIDVESRDEIGTLAEAFNGVNAATLAIAGEQAALRGSISEMFVNVARRDQVLLNRQLSSIDEMERTEDDPGTLTKLFALDHLATRMRRNSESLLVLAGIDTGRRLRRPMPLSDVIRTASSEIELYERVELELDADPSMLGHSALTAAHLFAELLENATVFSDPGSPVVVRTGYVDGNYVVEVEDSGIGMTEKELADANNRVASTAASEILGAQRLGLFVVGRIARRVGARVTLRSEESKGTIATVTMPPSLFTPDDDGPTTHISTTATDEATHAPAALVSHHVADEISEVPERATANAGAAYAPAVIEEGASLLAGRGGKPEPEVDDTSIEALIAADAAAAPAVEQTSPEDLTSGVSGTGLPTRRRREAPAPADAEREQQSIVGLPARATDAQLSALEAEQVGGFTPAVSPSEITPQSAEERASMFRGFRPRRETEAAAALEPDDESLGHAARRSGLDAAAVVGADAPADEASEPPPMVVPSLEPDDESDDEPVNESDAPAASSTPEEEAPEGDASGVVSPAGAAGGSAIAAAAFFGSRRSQAPEPASAAEPSTPSAADAQEPAAVAEPSAGDDDGMPTFRMPKLETTAQESAASAPSLSAASAGEYEPTLAADEPMQSMVIPSLETDPDQGDVVEPAVEASAVSAPGAVSAPQADAEPTPYGGVESVSLDDPYAEPADSASDALAWAASAPSVPESAPWASVGTAPTSPSASEPSGDAAVAQAAWSEPEAVPEVPAAPAPATADPAVGFAAGAPAYEQAPVAEQPPVADDAPAEPSPAVLQDTPAPNLDDLIQGATDDETERRPGFFSRLFGRSSKKGAAEVAAAGAAAGVVASAPQRSQAPVFAPVTPTEAPSEPSAPAEPTGGFMPHAEPAPSDVPAFTAPSPSVPSTPAASASAPEVPAAPAPWEAAMTPQAPSAPEPAPRAFTPQAQEAPVFSGWEPAAAPEPAAASPAAFTPEELAQPSGWEAAGANALQAAEPEVATSYQPVIQPDSFGGGSSDMTSEVFSELSSLAAERPKVEKTNAGLQRRRPTDAAPVEVTPIEEEVSIAPAERDADAVRSRFSSFYSGTQKARDDVAAFERQSEAAEASDT